MHVARKTLFEVRQTRLTTMQSLGDDGNRRLQIVGPPRPEAERSTLRRAVAPSLQQMQQEARRHDQALAKD
jgi:hypothetical protein